LAKALGTGMGSDFCGESLRFERLLVLTDPDADGIHCGVLLLAFVHRFLRPLLDPRAAGPGRVAWVRAPWGEVVPVDGGPPQVAFSEEELVALAEQVRLDRAATTRRFRGLAAIDARLLARHCVDPGSRRADWPDARHVEGMLAMLAAAGMDGPEKGESRGRKGQ
jgi:DNA gyrase subunit B/topoisomerase-4 subunit B